MFDHVYSLGNKCEISLQLKNRFKTFEPCLFSWTNVLNDDAFIIIMNDPQCFLNDSIHFIRGTDDLYCFEEHSLWCHGRVPAGKIFDENGVVINETNYTVSKKEMRSRFRHLANKFKNQVKGEGKTLFIKQHCVNGDYEGTIKFIGQMEEFFNRNYESGQYCLLIVIEKCQMDPCLISCENEHVKIRTLDYFARTEDVFVSADHKGWDRIFEEFRIGGVDEKTD